MGRVAPARGARTPSAEDPERPSRRGGPPPSHAAGGGALLLSLGALGVVFGDIGTSPLYAMQAVFANAVEPTQEGVYGVVSLVFWAITIIVSLKYVTFIMRADNEGEGGIMALIARVQTVKLGGRAGAKGGGAPWVFCRAPVFCAGGVTPAGSVAAGGARGGGG